MTSSTLSYTAKYSIVYPKSADLTDNYSYVITQTSYNIKITVFLLRDFTVALKTM